MLKNISFTQALRASCLEGTAGRHNAAGAPNISGTVTGLLGGGHASGNGAFGDTSRGIVHDLQASPGSGDQDRQYYVTINASLSNSIYGKSNTIMPSSINILSIIYLGR